MKSAHDIVEPITGIIGGKINRRIDVETQNLSNRIRVFGAVQAVDAGRREFRLCGSGAIELGLKGYSQCFIGCSIRPRHPLRRHHAGAKLPHDFFPGLAIGSNARRIHFVEGESGGFRFLVVASDTVLIEQSARRVLAERQSSP